MGMTLGGRTALVTGAASGVGKGIALELAKAGAHVIVADIAADESMQRTMKEIEGLGVKALGVRADVRVGAQVREAIGRTVDRFGRLDIVVNNAGVQTWKPLLDVTEDEWDLVIETNLKGCFLCTQAAAIHMKTQGGGCIVNIGSGSNRIAFRGLVAYTASKGGIEMFTKVAAVELGPHRIRVNCVAPGAIEIERTRLERPDYAEAWGGMTPLGRVGTPQDIGRAVVFLAGDESAFITGQTIWVDGGLFSQPPWPADAARTNSPGS
jgi:3-oxoacyl-[acyl-carrier protein] reductase